MTDARPTYSRQRPIWACLPLLGLTACYGFAARPSGRQLSDAATDAGLVRYEIDTQAIGGISDLAVAVEGGERTFWLLPEQHREILALETTDMARERGDTSHSASATPIWPTHPVVNNVKGVPRGLDTEAFAILSPNRWLLGTESMLSQRTHDAVLLVEPQGLTASVVGQIDVPWGLWQLRAKPNEGIEGLCAVNGTIVMAGETTGYLPGRIRFAPIGRRGPGDASWTPFYLQLTSRTGKISAITCRAVAATDAGAAAAGNAEPKKSGLLEVVAIERHYQVGRLLRFFLPIDGPGGTIEPTDTFDLTNWLDPMPNFESIAWLNDDALLLVSDNAMAVQLGPTEALVVPVQNLAPVLPRSP